jgi:hypothetical protein
LIGFRPGAEHLDLAALEAGADDAAPGFQVGGWSDDGPFQAAGEEFLLGGVLGPEQRHRVVRRGALHGHQHDMLDAGRDRGPDQVAVRVAVDRLRARLVRPDEAVHRRDHRRTAAHGGGRSVRVA